MLKLGNLFLTMKALAAVVLRPTDNYTTPGRVRGGFPEYLCRIAQNYNKTSARSPPGVPLVCRISQAF